jgi:hypothetical protein
MRSRLVMDVSDWQLDSDSDLKAQQPLKKSALPFDHGLIRVMWPDKLCKLRLAVEWPLDALEIMNTSNGDHDATKSSGNFGVRQLQPATSLSSRERPGPSTTSADAARTLWAFWPTGRKPTVAGCNGPV